MLITHIQRIALCMLDDYSFKISKEVNYMPSFLGNVVKTMNVNTSKINISNTSVSTSRVQPE